MTLTGLSNFLGFFKLLSNKSPETFKKLLAENCDIKAIKVNGKVSNDKAEITLKDGVFAEVKKNVLKERAALRQNIKEIDFSNDKNANFLNCSNC